MSQRKIITSSHPSLPNCTDALLSVVSALFAVGAFHKVAFFCAQAIMFLLLVAFPINVG
jgi:hypothetical protein